MSKKFYLFKRGTQYGPFTKESVLQEIDKNQYQLTDYVFEESVGDWVMLMEHKDFSFKFRKSSAPLQASESIVKPSDLIKSLNEKEWFVLKGGTQFVPHSKLDIIKMLQAKQLFEHDFIFKEKMDCWKCIAELEEFSPDQIRRVKENSTAEVSDVFYRRRYPRAACGASLIVHNKMKVFSGKALEISAGGAGLIIDSNELQPGQSLFLHFKPAGDIRPFNAVCEIVHKQFLPEQNGEGQLVRYGVKFTTLTKEVRENIKEYAAKVA